MMNNQLSGPIPPELGQLSQLYILQLTQNRLSGSIPPELAHLSQLAALTLISNQLSGEIPPELGRLTRLEILQLSSNRLTGTIPRELGQLTELRGLQLGNNLLSGRIPWQLGGFPHLESLGLAANQLSGPIPRTLGKLLELRYLFLDGNRLRGGIPAELGDLTRLRNLSLRGNRLDGAVPDSFTRLTALLPGEGIDLRWNSLTATGPSVVTFLRSRHVGREDFRATQTVAPRGVRVESDRKGRFLVSWIPIRFTDGAGHYEVSVGRSAAGPFEWAGAVSPKTARSRRVTGLAPGVYYFRVRTVTKPHGGNANTVFSEWSRPVRARSHRD